MDASQAEQFREATYDLLEKLTMRAGMPPKAVYISSPQPMTTFYANIDNDLRESMRHIGYAISDTPQNAYIFTYEATPLMNEGDAVAQSINNVQLTLRVFDSYTESARQLTEETGQYFIQGAELLEMGPANQAFLKPSAKNIFKKKVNKKVRKPVMQKAAPVQAVMPAPMREVMMAPPPVQAAPIQAPIPKPIPAPMAMPTPPPAPVITAPKASVPSVSRAVSAPASMRDSAPPTEASRSIPAGTVSSSSFSSQEKARNAIKVINRGVAKANQKSMAPAASDNLPSIAEIEAEIRQLEAEINAQ